MLVTGNVKIELDFEQSQEVVVECLKGDYLSILKDYEELKNLEYTLEQYQKDDIEDYKRYLDAIEILLRYYMYVGDAEEFLRGTKGVYIKE
jgi:hypothetical protein